MCIDRGAQKVGNAYACHSHRVLEREEKTELGSLISFHLQHILAAIQYFAVNHFVTWMSRQRICQGALA
jgi:hypothetical protein